MEGEFLFPRQKVQKFVLRYVKKCALLNDTQCSVIKKSVIVNQSFKIRFLVLLKAYLYLQKKTSPATRPWELLMAHRDKQI